MNLALPALVILLGLLPGICFFYGYFAGRFDRRQAGVGGIEELALFVVFAVPMDAAALWVCRFVGIDFDFGVASRMLSGTASESAAASVAAIFGRHAHLSAITYTVILGFGYLLGALARRIVWSLRLDPKIPLLRLRHDWFYVLQGRLRGMPRVVLPWVDVLTEHPDGSRLYKGFVLHFELTSNGSLESLTLTDASRGHGRGKEFEWKAIPTSRLTLMGSRIHSINVRYVTLENQTRRGPLRKLRTWWRSFMWEEP